MQFGLIAKKVDAGCSTDELLDMIEKMGHHVDRENRERIVLYYDFKKSPFPFHSTGKYRESRKMHYMWTKTDGILHLSKVFQNTFRERECSREKVTLP